MSTQPVYSKSQPESEKLVALEPKDSLLTVRDPGKILKEAIRAAEALKRVIDAKPHKVVLNGETYLENEDWLTVARFYGITSRIRSTKFVNYGDLDYVVRGFEATAEAYLVERGEVISTAESMCLSDEAHWKNKPLFQLRSMAQTRASSRVLRQVLGWVVVLAGYKPTPAEELQENNLRITRGHLCADCGEDVTDEEAAETRKKFKKALCRVCRKQYIRAQEGQVMQPMQDPDFVRKSVEQARNGRPQPVTRVIDHTDRDEIAGD